MFVGRENELQLLNGLFDLKKAAIAVCAGRRRIGKSTLIQQFGKNAKAFLEFQGLPPREGITKKNQLNAFSEQLAKQTSLPKLNLESWYQAFSLLNNVIKNERTVILLDEISWMATRDKDFAGQLKIVWDTEFKHHSKLILVLCGSVSSWIDENILNSAGFVGRISLKLTPQELSLFHCNMFWGKKTDRIDAKEKLKMLAVTGGVPRYLEEINPNLPAEENIRRICFSKEGFLYSEFEQIFRDIFSRRAPVYKRIVSVLVRGPKSISELAEHLGRKRGGDLSRYLDDLSASGFIAKDVVFRPGKKDASKLAKYRLKDNYLRFYLKYLEPIKAKIEKGLFSEVAIESLSEWETIMGLQFENLVLNNIRSVCSLLAINMNTVISAAPYFQRKTQRKKPCQIDLLIETKYTLYVCEIKFRKKIPRVVISEVRKKIERLKSPAGLTVRPVLIYSGGLASGIEEDGFFDKIIHFEKLLSSIHV
jgi:AAA+ ATPase superfamily predicted ATPase